MALDRHGCDRWFLFMHRFEQGKAVTPEWWAFPPSAGCIPQRDTQQYGGAYVTAQHQQGQHEIVHTYCKVC